MKALKRADFAEFAAVRFVLTDMDETLTYRGRLAAATYVALERLQQAGVVVIPVTAAPAGWCDQMARMWPVDGVIAENGGLFLHLAADGRRIQRQYWHDRSDQALVSGRLTAIADEVGKALPWATHADDQDFRLTSLAFDRPDEPNRAQDLIDALRRAGAEVTVNNIWVIGWVGAYDKLAMARRVLAETHGLDIEVDPDAVLYCGDSENDAPMFGFFRHTVGVSTVRRSLARIPVAPRWITEGPGGAGFVEAANAVVAARCAR